MKEEIFTHRQMLVRGLISFTLFFSLVVPSYYAWQRLQPVSPLDVGKVGPVNRPDFELAVNGNRQAQRPAGQGIRPRAERAFRSTQRTDTMHRALSRDRLFIAAYGRTGQLTPADTLPQKHYQTY